MKSEYIRKADVVKALDGKIIVTGSKNADAVLQYMKDISNKIKSLKPAADVVPYSIDPDGTLTVTVPKGTKRIGRILIEEDGTQYGGLFYPDTGGCFLSSMERSEQDG